MSIMKNVIALALASVFAVGACAATVEPNLAAFAEGMRSNYRALIPSAGAPDSVAEVRSVLIPGTDPAHGIPARLYVPHGATGRSPLPMVLFVHGGGFVSGDLDTHDVLVRAMANGTHALVVSIDYRLAPEFPFPAGLNDGYDALQWMAAHAAELGGDASRMAVSGDSAGGNIATAVAILTRDRHGPQLKAQWLMYPSLSNKMDTPSWKEFGETNFPTRAVNSAVIASYVPAGTSPYAPLVAPLWAEHQNLPPTLVQVGSVDPLRDENEAYVNSIKRSGGSAQLVIYDKEKHGFIQFFKNAKENPQGEAAVQAGVAFLRKALSAD